MEAIRVEVPKELHGLDAPLKFTYWPPLLVLQQCLLRMPRSQVERMHWNFEKCGTTGAQQVFSEFHTGLTMQVAGAVQTRLSAQHTLALAVYTDAFAMCDRYNGHPFYMECFNTADKASAEGLAAVHAPLFLCAGSATRCFVSALCSREGRSAGFEDGSHR